MSAIMPLVNCQARYGATDIGQISPHPLLPAVGLWPLPKSVFAMDCVNPDIMLVNANLLFSA